MQKPKLESVEVRAIPDECPDTSWIGEYTNKASGWVICRHCGEFLWDAERYGRIADELEGDIEAIEEDIDKILFGSGPNDRSKRLILIRDAMERVECKFGDKGHDCPTSHQVYNYFRPYASGEKEGTVEYRNYGKQDFEMMERLNNGEWYFVGIQARAIVRDCNGQSQEFTSGGIWGVESDAEEYIEGELKEEELDDLYDQLHKYGVETSNWKSLVADIKVKW